MQKPLFDTRQQRFLLLRVSHSRMSTASLSNQFECAPWQQCAKVQHSHLSMSIPSAMDLMFRSGMALHLLFGTARNIAHLVVEETSRLW